MIDELRAKFEAFHGLSWDGIRTLLVNDGTKLSLRNVYKHDFEVWQAAYASRDAEVEALRKDAKRYRWLRKNHNADLLAEDIIDEAIGAARQPE